MKPVLLIFAKAPAMGRSKTRLARDLGAGRAWQIKRRMDAATLAVACPARGPAGGPWQAVLAVASRSDLTVRLPGVWPAADQLERRLQGPGSLGARLQRHLRGAGRSGRAVAVIGTDCPGLRRDHLVAAFRRVARGPRQNGRPAAVIGPAEDGGFWLLALPARLAARIDLGGIAWSSADTLTATVSALPRGTLVHRLAILGDVDTGDDWMRSKKLLRPRSGRP